ncbi:MAG TPA: hypothetical protein VGM98_10310, partial [Schlesneria sp.]
MIALPPIQGRDWSRVCIACAAVVAFSLSTTPVQADLVKLLNGGELRGRITGGTATSRLNAESIMIETLSGVVVSVARADMKFLTMRPVVVEEYETRARRMSDTLQAHWDLSEWCRQQSLSKQRD